jgi:hypothetical protein
MRAGACGRALHINEDKRLISIFYLTGEGGLYYIFKSAYRSVILILFFKKILRLKRAKLTNLLEKKGVA